METLPASLPASPLPKTRHKEVVITKRYDEILHAVHVLRYVTVSDITRLFFSSAKRFSSTNHAGEILSKLAGGGDYKERQYLYRFPLPHLGLGNSQKVYTLGSRGRAYLQSLGMSVDWHFRPYKVASMSYQHCQHALALTRFLVAAQVLCRTHPEWKLEKLKTEYELKQEISLEKAKREAATVLVGGKNKDGKAEEDVIVIPDAWLLFHHPTSKKERWQPVFLEIDRASEQQKFFKKQVRARLLFLASGGYKKLFGTNKGVIAYATTGNETRRKTMMAWTHEVITELNMKTLASRFRFCSLTPSWEQDAVRVFLSPLWYRALEKHPVPLLA